MALAEYKRKRRFNKTPEPAGKVTIRRSRGLQFVVQKHAARRLHYDFRLELDGVLLSWAVPQGPSLDSRVKRLAVHVEDHPLVYASFEGRIPAGEYGAGEVIVWDRGTWTPDGDPRAGLNRGKLEFQLDGEKLSGGWRLLRLKGRSAGDKDHWLLIKRRDEFARDEAEFSITIGLPTSVKSGRLLGENHGIAFAVPLETPQYPFALATLVDKPPPGNQWFHEIKFDGYRLLAAIHAGKRGRRGVRLVTRNHLDWTNRYPAIALAAIRLPVKSAVLDGELVALDEAGVSRFQLLQNAGKKEAPLAYYAFDLLEHDGEDLRSLPLAMRKNRLRDLLSGSTSESIRYSDHLQDRGEEFLIECCQRGLEGIVSKRADRPYQPGRTRDWLKVKCRGREELVIGAYTDSPAAGREFGALLVGYFRSGELKYAGRVGTGFDSRVMKSLHPRLQRLEQKESPFRSLPARERVRGVHWVRPEVVAQIEFGSWTDAGILRHASFQGVRDDKPAINVGQPESLHAKPDHRNEAATMPARKQRSKRFASDALVELTHPDRVLYSDLGLTKQQLADYYARIADLLLPHIAGRPLALLRCPGGVDGKCFFQKHATAGTPEALRRVPIAEKGETEDYLVVDDVAGLWALAQMSILELHPWGSLAGREEQPDRLIFDLDPGPAVKWTALVEAAFALRDALARLHLKSFVKTSGSQGLHVVSPLIGCAPWSALKQFARAIAEHFAQEQPARYTAKIAKAARQGRIFIDYLRNDRGATAVAPYSPRARAGAPVSMPLSWEELPSIEHAAQFTVPALLAGQRPRDPWRGFHRLKQRLPDFAFQET